MCGRSEEFMDQHKSIGSERSAGAGVPVTVDDFIVRTYLPYVKDQKKPSTRWGYGQLWRNQVKRALDANLRLRHFLPKHGHTLMQTAGKREGGISKTPRQRQSAAALAKLERVFEADEQGRPDAAVPHGSPVN